MSTTAPDVDLSTLEALDWHHETPCTVPACQYGHPPARWRIPYSCGCAALLCEPCRVELLGLAGTDDPPQVADCLMCGRTRVVTVRDLIARLEPLA